MLEPPLGLEVMVVERMMRNVVRKRKVRSQLQVPGPDQRTMVGAWQKGVEWIGPGEG